MIRQNYYSVITCSCARKLLALLLIVGCAQTYATSPKRHSFDLEVDPIAYLLNGYSLHGGYLTGAWRFDLGVFGLDIPEWAHGNQGFEASASGIGWKIDRFLKGKPEGFFIGIEGNGAKTTITHKDSRDQESITEYALGLRGGYRWNSGYGKLHITPWLGLGYVFNAKDVEISGDKYHSSSFQPFPTVHLGFTL